MRLNSETVLCWAGADKRWPEPAWQGAGQWTYWAGASLLTDTHWRNEDMRSARRFNENEYKYISFLGSDCLTLNVYLLMVKPYLLLRQAEGEWLWPHVVSLRGLLFNVFSCLWYTRPRIQDVLLVHEHVAPVGRKSPLGSPCLAPAT